MGRLAIIEEQPAKALPHYNNSLQAGGDAYKEVHLELARLYEQLGNPGGAREHYLKTLEAPSVDPLGSFDRAAREGINRIRGEMAQELVALEEAIELNPTNFDAHARLAFALHEIGMYERAETHYRSALQLDQSSWQAWHNLALVYEKTGRCTEAIPAFEESLQRYPDNTSAINHIGRCQTYLGDNTAAIESFRRALMIDPSYFDAQFNLCRALFSSGEDTEARACFERALKLTQDNPALMERITGYIDRLPS